MPKRFAVPVVGVLVFATSVLAGAAASAALTESGDHERSDRFWSLTRVRAMAAESYDTLTQMTLASDAIVVGRISAIAPGREWKANEDEWLDPEAADALLARFATVTLEIQDVIGGAVADASAGTVELEIFLPHDGLVPQLEATLPRERAVFFLRTKADAPEFFRLVNDSQGLIREFEGTSHMVGAVEGTFLAEIDGRPFGELLAQLRSIVP